MFQFHHGTKFPQTMNKSFGWFESLVSRGERCYCGDVSCLTTQQKKLLGIEGELLVLELEETQMRQKHCNNFESKEGPLQNLVN